MTNILWLDTETFNDTIDLKTGGTYRYAETCEVMLVPYALDDGPVQLWDRTVDEYWPEDLDLALNGSNCRIVAHHAMFDRPVVAHGLWAPTCLTRWHCTMTQAYCHGLPGGLDVLGSILGLGADHAKIKDGKRLVQKFCKLAPKNHKVDRYDRHNSPEDWERFCGYAKRDVAAMREVYYKLPDWNYRGRELDLFHLDQRINDRGFFVDKELTAAAVASRDVEKNYLASRCQELTNGRVLRPTMREELKQFLNEEFGYLLTDTKAETFNQLMASADPVARELMHISIASNKNSTAKYAALQEATSEDGRFRGGLQFAGASRTRRWAGRKFQGQNLPSRGIPPAESIEAYIDALKAGCHEFLFDDLMLCMSAALRGAVVAPEGKKLVVSDLSNIEGRVNAWLAGETWKLEAFEAFDRGEGPDLYNVTASSILGKDPYSLSKTERNVMGKVPDLALGYEGGVGAFQTFAAIYGVRMIEHWDAIEENLGGFVQYAQANWTKWGQARNDGLIPKDEWIASETVKLAWRDRHQKIRQFWYACEDAAVSAICNSGKAFKVGKHIVFKALNYKGFNYLLVRMPSGNFLVYFNPKYNPDTKSLSYWGVDSMATGGAFAQWQQVHTYGGKLVENLCQSCARDVLAYNMPLAEERGYEIILTVHDELVTETPDSAEFTHEDLSAIIATNPPWGEGLPLAAAGYEAKRYKKDD